MPGKGRDDPPRSLIGALLGALLVAVPACRSSERDLGPPEASAWMPARAPAPVRLDAPATEADAPAAGFTIPPRPGATPISLEQVLQVAGHGALRLRMAQEDAKAAEAEEQLVFDSLLPTLHLRAEFTLADGQVQNTAGEFFDVDERQNAFLGPAARASFDPAVAIFRADEAAERADAFAHGVRAAANDVRRDAAFLYFDLVEAFALVEIAKSSVQHYRDLVTHERSRVGSGASLESNLLRAQARLARANQELVVAENDASGASTALVELLRMDPELALAPATQTLERIELVPEAPLEGLVAQGLRRRPEVHRARALYDAERAAEDFWKKRWMVPRLDLLAQYGGFGEDFGDRDENQYYQAGLTWDFAVTDRSERARARAAQRRAGFVEEAVVRAVSREVLDAHAAAASAGQSIGSATDEVEKTQEIFDLLSVRYERGAAEQVEVLWAEIELTRAQVAFVRSLTRYNRAQYDLLRAIGG